MVREWNMLRVVACLSIVLLHSTTNIGRAVGFDQLTTYHIYRIMLCYATPTFIVLSEIILSNKYQTTLPGDFFRRRVKFIIGPFIAFAIIDAIIANQLSMNDINLLGKIQGNLLGNYEGYFILIIFQFYVLHYIILRLNISVKKLLPVSIVIMAVHLYYLHSDLGALNEYKNYLKLPFTAWLGYFTAAFLIGKHYESIAKFLKNYRWLTLILAGFSIYLLFLSFQSGNGGISSRRIDLFPLTISVSLAVLAWGQLLPNLKIINFISNYSLGIYLMHWQVQRVIAPYVADIFTTIQSQVAGLFIISLTITIFFIKLISMLPFGSYIVGNIKRKTAKERKQVNSNESKPSVA